MLLPHSPPATQRMRGWGSWRGILSRKGVFLLGCLRTSFLLSPSLTLTLTFEINSSSGFLTYIHTYMHAHTYVYTFVGECTYPHTHTRRMICVYTLLVYVYREFVACLKVWVGASVCLSDNVCLLFALAFLRIWMFTLSVVGIVGINAFMILSTFFARCLSNCVRNLK